MDSIPNGIGLRLRHTMLPVADIDRSLDFYTRVLGMAVFRQRGKQGDKVIAAYVGYGSDEGSAHALELIQGQGDAGKSWEGHFALAVSDLESFGKFLHDQGVEFTEDVHEARSGGSNRRLAWIKDPDGYAIELTERKDGINS